jgi:DNA-binding SARP family transcriptional activator
MEGPGFPATAPEHGAETWAEVRLAAASGDAYSALQILREATRRSEAFEREAAPVLAVCEALVSFDGATATIEEAHALALQHRSLQRELLAKGLTALLGGGSAAPAFAPASTEAAATTIPFRLGIRLGIVEERLPLALRGARREIRARLLGGIEIEADGQRIGPWRNQKARLVTAFLLAHRGEAVSRQLLMGTFWPEHSEERAANNLSLAIMASRRLLDAGPVPAGESILRALGGSYTFDSGVNIWVDLHAFREAAHMGRTLHDAGDAFEAAASLDEAISLYAGDFLPNDLYQDWTIELREALRDTFIDVLMRRSRIARVHGERELALGLARRVLDADPCIEEAHRQLMLDYATLGQRGRALRQMELCREALDRHMGVGPEAETLAVYERIRGR